jgi:hypothetical protein
MMNSKSIPHQVYLSYARNDDSLASVLSEELRRQGFKVWFEPGTSPGDEGSDQILKALNQSDAMIALLNQHSYSSSYVRNELKHAFFDDRYKDRLLPVLIGSSSDEGFVRLPWVLTKLTYLKLSENLTLGEMAKTISDEFIALLEGRRSER